MVGIFLRRYILLKHAANFRNFSSGEPFENVAKKPSPSRVTRVADTALRNEMKQYLQSKPCLNLVSSFIPDRFLRIKKSPTCYSFVVDDEIAAQFVDAIKHELKDGIPIVEANPGLGLITRYLLKAGIPHVTVFDPVFDPMPPLVQLINDNPHRISVIPSNFFEINKFISQDKMDNGERFQTMFKDFTPKAWNDEPSIKVVGSLLSPLYIHWIVKSIAFQDAFIKLGRVEHIIALSEPVYKSLVGSRKQLRLRTLTLFNLFFDVEVKGHLPRSSFLPWDSGKGRENIMSQMYLVKITPKRNIYENYSEDHLKSLYYFLQDICRSRSCKVIAYFEKWMPLSGLKLIKEGISPSTEVGDLTTPEIMELFQIFISLPEFNDTNYIHIQESGLLSESIAGATTSKPKSIKISF